MHSLRCERSEAIQWHFSGEMDCFAALAMTAENCSEDYK
jgi:hypothetical protein